MRKRLMNILLCLMVLLPGLTLTARADCAPKPTTSVQVTESRGRQIIVTLLGDTRRYGPNSAVGPEEEAPADLTDSQQAAWKAFRDYDDPEGYCFWGQMDWYGMDWRYYPPEKFKVAVYYPGTDTLVVSRQSFERYAFHSDFRIYLEAETLAEQATVTLDMALERDVDWMEEVAEFLSRVTITLAVEVAIALAFGYRGPQAAKAIVLVNLVTQVGLNVLLSLWYIFDGPLNAMLRLIVAELVVLAVEGFYYRKKLADRGKGRAVAYALVANVASVCLGWLMID